VLSYIRSKSVITFKSARHLIDLRSPLRLRICSRRSPPSTSSKTKPAKHGELWTAAITVFLHTDVIIVLLVENLFQFTDVGVLEVLHDTNLPCKGSSPRIGAMLLLSWRPDTFVVYHLDGVPFARGTGDGFHNGCKGAFSELRAEVVVGIKASSRRTSGCMTINKTYIQRISREKKRYQKTRGCSR
jgi:hypothetical protein